MKKFAAVLLSIIMIFMMSACTDGGSEKSDSGKSGENIIATSMAEFNKDATIDEVTLYDENDIKITANELTYSDYSADLSITMENNTDKSLRFVCNSAAYCVNSVNGYMVEKGFFCDIAPGETATEALSLDYETLNVYGITQIADMELGFYISDDEYDISIYTEPVQIKTSAADSYDYSVNSYRNVINNGAFETRFNCKKKYFSEEKLYDKNNICVASAVVMTREDGESSLLLEIENNSGERINAKISEVKVNNCMVYDSLWSAGTVTSNKKFIELISLSKLVGKYEGEFEDVSKISDISFKLSIEDKTAGLIDSEIISIALPDIEIPEEE